VKLLKVSPFCIQKIPHLVESSNNRGTWE